MPLPLVILNGAPKFLSSPYFQHRYRGNSKTLYWRAIMADPKDLYDTSIENNQLSEESKQLLGETIKAIQEKTREISQLIPEDITESRDPWLERGGRMPPADEWAKFAENLIKNVFNMVLKDYQIKLSGNVSLCICGSLARRQATPYSDIDCFVILENEDDTPNLKEAMEGFYQLFHRIETETRQFMMDIVGINPKQICGTPEEIYNHIREIGHEALITSLINAKALFEPELLKNLHASIRQDKDLRDKLLADSYYNLAIDEYSGPRDTKQIFIKRDLLRPLDFILSGLRHQFQLYEEDGSHLGLRTALDRLLEDGHIDRIFHELILSSYDKAYNLRIKKHLDAGSESEDVIVYDEETDQEITDIRELVDRVAIIRATVNDWREQIKQSLNTVLSVENLTLPNYLDKSFEGDTRVFNLGTTIYNAGRRIRAQYGAEERQEERYGYYHLGNSVLNCQLLVNLYLNLEELANNNLISQNDLQSLQNAYKQAANVHAEKSDKIRVTYVNLGTDLEKLLKKEGVQWEDYLNNLRIAEELSETVAVPEIFHELNTKILQFKNCYETFEEYPSIQSLKHSRTDTINWLKQELEQKIGKQPDLSLSDRQNHCYSLLHSLYQAHLNVAPKSTLCNLLGTSLARLIGLNPQLHKDNLPNAITEEASRTGIKAFGRPSFDRVKQEEVVSVVRFLNEKETSFARKVLPLSEKREAELKDTRVLLGKLILDTKLLPDDTALLQKNFRSTPYP